MHEVALTLFVCAFAVLNLISNHFISKRLDAQSERLNNHFRWIQEFTKTPESGVKE